MSIFNLVVTLHITPAFFQGGGVSRSGGHPQEDDQEPQREDEGQLVRNLEARTEDNPHKNHRQE